MAGKLVYYDEVFLDISDAKSWYFKQQRGLEKRFSEDVKKSIRRLQRNSLHYEIKYKEVRLVHCTNFPYSVHFYVDHHLQELVVIAVVHQHRNPELSKSRK